MTGNYRKKDVGSTNGPSQTLVICKQMTSCNFSEYAQYVPGHVSKQDKVHDTILQYWGFVVSD